MIKNWKLKAKRMVDLRCKMGGTFSCAIAGTLSQRFDVGPQPTSLATHDLISPRLELQRLGTHSLAKIRSAPDSRDKRLIP